MESKITSPQEYLENLPAERKEPFSRLRETIISNLPHGFEETINYGMIGYVIPLSLYPPGYHCDPKLPLPFINIASQKNFIAFYHMGIYADEKILSWFKAEYPNHSNVKPDMGKSCIRFKKPWQIPYDLLGELCQKITPLEWISLYENTYKR